MNYPGAGQATLLRTNHQAKAWAGERTPASIASVAFELERINRTFYPWGFAVEVAFSGNPGTFVLDVQGAETDTDANYITLAAIANAQMNSGYVARGDYTTYFPKFVRLYTHTLPNDVSITAIITR